MTNNLKINNILTKKVSVVIPNYNGQHLLKKFLPFVLSSLRDGDELIIVDDCSTDHSVSFLIKKFKLKPLKRTFHNGDVPVNYNPNIDALEYKLYGNKIIVKEKNNSKKIMLTLVSQMINLRFAASANVGVLMARNKYIFLLNNDVRPTRNVIDKLLENFFDKQVFAVGCLEYEKDKFGEKAGKNKLWFSQGLFKHSKEDNFQSGDTAWVSGGSGMFDREKWLTIGGFDKRFYPAYWEDVDLSFQARKKGWKVLFEEKAIVYHVHESTNMDEFGKKKIDEMSWRNAQKFVKKNGNLLQKLLFFLYKFIWDYKQIKHSS